MEMLHESLKAKGQPTKLIRKNLLIKYCRNKDLEKAEEIRKVSLRKLLSVISNALLIEFRR